jgi:hypothetical protein
MPASRYARVIAIAFALGGPVMACGVAWFQVPGNGAPSKGTATAASTSPADGDGTTRAVVPVVGESPATFPLVVRPGQR